MDQTDTKAPRQPQARPASNSQREAKLAQALRANLRRRKSAGETPSSSDD